MSKPLVFISYSHHDKFLAYSLVEEIKKRTNFDVWWDSRIEGGELWLQEITNALSNCVALVVIVSLDSLNSQYVIHECSVVTTLGKKVIPIIFRPLTDQIQKSIPAFLSQLQILDFSDPEHLPWDKLFTSLNLAKIITTNETMRKAEAFLALEEYHSIDLEVMEMEFRLIDLRKELVQISTTQRMIAADGKNRNEQIISLEIKDAPCPVCGQVLSDEQRKQILVDLSEEHEIHRNEFRLLTIRYAEIVDELANLQDDIMDKRHDMAVLWSKFTPKT